jgi:SAM-dependent methyltransferase
LSDRGIGLVENFDATKAAGWVRAAEPAKVSLCVNETPLCTTWAARPLERDGYADARFFRFNLSDIWTYVTPADHLSIRVDRTPIPIEGHGAYFAPGQAGSKSSGELIRLLKGDHVFNKLGKLQISKLRDRRWQDRVGELYGELYAAMKEIAGYDVFAFYGTMLGAVRAGDFIGHDNDFDTAYISAFQTPGEVRQELVALCAALVERGFHIKPKLSCVLVSHPAAKGAKIDLFHLYFDETGKLALPFGIASDLTMRREDYLGVKEGSLGRLRVVLPQPAEQFAALIYGDDWKLPNPGFSWKEDKKSNDPGALLRQVDRSTIHWNSFYADREPSAPSTFCDYVRTSPHTFKRVLDFGCGDGRDTIGFGAAGFTSLGLDQAEQGVRHARDYVSRKGLGDRVAFAQADVGDHDQLAAIIQQFLDADASGAPTLFYSRFFLHSLNRATRASFLRTVAGAMRPNDVLALEFRTEKDKNVEKVHKDHFREFVSPGKLLPFLRRLKLKAVVVQTGNGFSPYKGEDPQLCRIIARRR